MALFKIFIYGSLLGIILASDSFEFRTNDDDECISSLDNTEGFCVESKNCDLLQEQKRKLNICSFNGKTPIICCPKSDVKNGDRVLRKSAESELFI